MKRRRNWDRLVPPGKSAESRRKWLVGGLWACGIWAVLAFLIKYFEALSLLELTARRYPEQSAGLIMPGFDSLLPIPLLPFLVVLAAALPQIYVNYACFRQGSRSDYLMRRLPDRWEWHRRCLAVPAMAIFGAALLAVALVMAFFLLYQWNTPYEWLPVSGEGALEGSGGIYRLLCGIFC